MNTPAALQQPKLVPVWTPAPDAPDLYTVKTTDPDTGRDTVLLCSSREPGRDLVELFVKHTTRKGRETTAKGYTTYIRQFAKWIDDRGTTRPVFDDIRTYADDLATRGRTDGTQDRPLSAGTQAQYLRGVKMFFAWTQRAGIYPDVTDDIDVPTVRRDIHRRDALTRDEQQLVEDSIDTTTAAGKRLLAMVELAGRRGLRVVEISRLTFDDLDEKNGVHRVNIWGKGHDEPDIWKAIDSDTHAAIVDYLTVRGDHKTTDPLFVSTSNNSKGKQVAATTISGMLKGALVNAGLISPRLTAHSFRHGAITRAMEESNDNIQMAMEFARHADPSTTERYLHRNIEAADATLVAKIENSYHDTEDAAATRQTLEDIIITADGDQLVDLAQTIVERGLDNGRL